MTGMKRPYPHDERVSFTGTPPPIETGKRVLLSESGQHSNITSSVSLWTTPSINRCNDQNTDCDNIAREHKPSPAPWLSSPSSGDSIEVTSSIESVWTTPTAHSNNEAVETGKERDEIEICFGMLVNGLLSMWKSSPISKISSSRPEASILTPRFRDDGITILNSELQELGVLDNETARGISSLKKAVSSVRFGIYISQRTKQLQSLNKTLGIPLELLVFGPRKSLGQIGSLLSQSGLFLQEPTNRQFSVPYKNPHVFSWDEDEDDDTNSSYLLQPSSNSQTSFIDKIQAVLNDTNAPRLSFQVEQDEKITSILKQHQLIALKFMIAREGLMETDQLTLWKTIDRNGRRVFKNEITHSVKVSKPLDCRGGILADEMGMGKSLSLLALIIYTLNSQRSKNEETGYPPKEKDKIWSSATLIIAPKSTIQGWEQQVNKHTQSGALNVHIYHGNGRRITCERLRQFDIVLTTYETAASDASTCGILSGIFWLRIVLDEAHQIRNRSTRNFQELTKLCADRRWCLTGTPVQNQLSDLFSLTQFLRFQPLENYANARKYILEPLSRKDPQGLEHLRLALQTISLRRTKQSCSNRQRIEATERVILNERERCCYTATRNDARKLLESVTGKFQGQILLRALNTLRQICSHGGVITDAAPDIEIPHENNNCDSCGDFIDTRNEYQQSFHGACGHKVCHECTLDQNGPAEAHLKNMPKSCSICQEPVISALEDLQQRNCDRSQSTLMDWQPTTPRSNIHSSKIETVVIHLQKLEQTSPANIMEPIKSLVFSHWSRTLDGLEKALSYHGMLYGRIDGSLSIDQRRSVLHEFSTNPDIRVLLLSYGVGSVGLNLQAATHVHLLEPHWNPMVEAQAAARVDRLDQTKDVCIYRYIVKDSIEENIQNRQRRKLQDVELSVSRMATGGDLDTAGVDSTDLKDLL